MMNSYREYASSWGSVAAYAAPNERTSFIRKTYAHVLLAVAAFIGIEAVLQATVAEQIVQAVFAARYGWVLALLGFMVVNWVAAAWARNSVSPAKQYLGLGLYVVAEAVIFVPLLYIATRYGGPNIVPMAGVITGLIFTGLTATVFFTKHDFSYLGGFLSIAGWAAVAVALCSALFGFSLGLIFSVAMIGLAAGYILYDTSNIMNHYRLDQHVAAALALFASIATLFYYVLRMLMQLQSRD